MVLPRADVPNDEGGEVRRLGRIAEAMRTAGPRETWPTARCRTCQRPDVVVIRWDGRLHPHTDPHDGERCRDAHDYREPVGAAAVLPEADESM